MDLLLSCALLVFFVAVVEFTAVGSVGDGIVGLFGGLFSHPDHLAWPKGVQEDDDPPLADLIALYRLERRRRWSETTGGASRHSTPENEDDGSAAWLTAEIVDDVPAVPVARVRRLS